MTDFPKNAEGLRMRVMVLNGEIRVTMNQEVVGEELAKFAPSVLRAAADQLEQKNKPLAKIMPRGGMPGGNQLVN